MAIGRSEHEAHGGNLARSARHIDDVAADGQHPDAVLVKSLVDDIADVETAHIDRDASRLVEPHHGRRHGDDPVRHGENGRKRQRAGCREAGPAGKAPPPGAPAFRETSPGLVRLLGDARHLVVDLAVILDEGEGVMGDLGDVDGARLDPAMIAGGAADHRPVLGA